MFPEWTWIVGFFLGATIGSFLNVVIYRLPLGMSIAEPRHSICPNCRNRLGPSELIPLFSWLFQRGKCAQCGVKIPPRYFVVELITGFLWAVIWYQQLVVSPSNDAYLSADPVKAVGYMIFSAALVVAIFTDLAHFIIPDEVNAAMFFAGVGMNIAYYFMGSPLAWMWGMPSSVAGALVGIGILWGITFLGRIAFGKDAMGHGDIKMARGIGAVLLPMLAGISFGLAVILGAVVGILALWIGNRKKAENQAEPEQDEEDDYEPESIGSLIKSLFGYLLLADIIGMFIPKVYMWWFGEDPRHIELADEDFEVEPTMIPFGPSLAGGAVLAMLMSAPLTKLVMDYWNSIVGP